MKNTKKSYATIKRGRYSGIIGIKESIWENGISVNALRITDMFGSNEQRNMRILKRILLKHGLLIEDSPIISDIQGLHKKYIVTEGPKYHESFIAPKFLGA